VFIGTLMTAFVCFYMHAYIHRYVTVNRVTSQLLDGSDEMRLGEVRCVIRTLLQLVPYVDR